MRITLPPGLESRRDLGEPWGSWLDVLPMLVAELLAEWSLRPGAELWHGWCALVVPVTTRAGGPAVLKVSVPDEETAPEHHALQRWQGRGAVRMLRADPLRNAMLLERLERTDLGDAWDEEACEVVAGLYRDLHVPPLPQLRSQGEVVGRWLDALAADLRELPMPRRYAEQALAVGRDLLREDPTAVVHGDLHYANVLLGARDGGPQWLAIDPKPFNGDPHYELEPMLRNRFDEYGEVGSVRDGIRRRFHTLVDTAELDEARARDWVVVRSVVNAHWNVQAAARADRPGGAGRALTPAERDQITRCITLAKAVQD